ncbi:MAG: lysophospholipase [Candidatus Omnitrophica bacterium]|nr:lysophospholipase [Candidatus Omnitrophota bacterium]
MNGVSSLDGEWVEPASRRRLAYRCWRPAAAPRALLIIVHGFGEHGGRHRAFAEALAGQGIWVGVPDLWGHGRSDGRRGDVEQVADYVRQLQGVTRDVFLPQSGLSSYALFGHSFGGLLAILWALEQPAELRRVILQSPLLEVGFPLPRWETAAASLLAACWPTCPFSLRFDVERLSHDAGVVQAYRDDPLVHHIMTARTYRSLLRARDEAMARAASIRAPVLLLLAGADRVVSIEWARRWFDRLTCEKHCEVFPDSYHELHHEAVRADVLQRVRDWALTNG